MKSNLNQKLNIQNRINIDTNLDGKDFAIIATFSRSKNIVDHGWETRSMIASTHLISGEDLQAMNLYSLPEKVDKDCKLFIYNIYLHTVPADKINEEISTNPGITIIQTEANHLFYPSNLTPSRFDLTMEPKYLKNSIFIFNNMDWHFIQSLFRLQHIIVSGGSTNKRHMLSPIEFRLSIFINWLFESSKASVAKSFHYEKLSLNEKNKKLPLNVNSKSFLDMLFSSKNKSPKEENETNKINNTPNINDLTKKEFHTSSRCLNSGKNLTLFPEPLINEKLNRNVTINFLEKIENIIKDQSISPLQAQILLENSWVDIMKEKHEDLDYLQKTYSPGFIQKLSYAQRTLDVLDKSGRLKYHFPTIYPFLNDTKLLILTYGMAVNSIIINIGYTNISSILGKKIISYLYVQTLKKDLNFIKKVTKAKSDSNLIEILDYYDTDNLSYIEFNKKVNFNQMDYIRLGNFYLDLLTRFPCDIFNKVFDETMGYQKNEVSKLEFNKQNYEHIKRNLIIEPASLPMLCEPGKWSETSYGGHILNSKIKEDIITGSTYHDHKMENRALLYQAINNMSSIKFSYNNSVLDYFLNEGRYLFDLMLTESEQLQMYTQLCVARAYGNIRPIYIPLQIDWRGRIYAKSFFANYQGSDLSISLLEFRDGSPLTESGLNYLYIYGANLFNDNNISKASYSDRINWTKENMNHILNMNKDFMLKAESRFMFVAFCLVMRELDKNPQHPVKLPVFLDATCSGIQHLAGLMKDNYLAEEVNLIQKEGSDVPADIYETLRIPINEEIQRIGREVEIFSNLEYVNLTRKDIKTPIMTKTYNVTRYGITQQLISNFTKISQPKTNKGKSYDFIKYQVPSIIEGQTVNLTLVEVSKIADILYNTIFIKYPGLNLIYSYFTEITKLLTRLNLPMIWLTPIGLELTQRYLGSKRTSMAISLGHQTNKLVLKEYTGLPDKAKQANAIIPNIIHSLDSAHIVNVINTGFDQNIKQIITIHDCFGTHPNYMSDLFEIVKLEFIKLYVSESFLDKFHDRNIQSIKDYGLPILNDEVKNQQYVQVRSNSAKLYIPNKPKLGSLNLWDIKNSKYLIT